MKLAENIVKYKSISSLENLSSKSSIFALQNFNFMI